MFRITHVLRSLPALLVLGHGLPALGTPAAAELLTTDLTGRRVRVHKLTEDTLSYFDETRRLMAQPVSRFVRVRFDRPAVGRMPADDGRVRVELVDGQRIVGAWAADAASGEAVHLNHDVLGSVRIGLDRVRSVTWDPTISGAGTPGPPSGDHLVLRNGDVLEGFLSEAGGAAVRITMQGQNEPLEVAVSSLASVTLANRPVPPAPRLDRVALVDDTLLGARNVVIENGHVTFEPAVNGSPADAVIRVALPRVRRVDLRRHGDVLVDLAGLPRAVTDGGRVFGVPWPPRVEPGRLRLHAPVTVRFDLPPGARRFAATAELEESRHDEGPTAAWADLVLRVAVDGAPRLEQRLSDAAAGALINVDAEGRTLSVEVDPARHGPVMDRLVLRDAFVLVRSGAAGR